MPCPGAGSAQTLTELSRAHVANFCPSGAQEQAQIMRACAFITLPTNLKGAPSLPIQDDRLRVK